MEVKSGDIVLCEFYFSDLKSSKRRPVLVFKDNLPFDDFIGIPISSQSHKLHNDEYLIDNKMFVTGNIPKTSKIMLRKTFVISKNAAQKKYGSLNNEALENYHTLFCQFFSCIK